MTRSLLLGLAAAAGSYFLLAFVAAVVTDSATDTLEQTNNTWLALSAIAGLLAGFLGNRFARPAPVAVARYAAAIAGPAAIALLFALTTTARDPEGPWFVLIAVAGAAAIGAHARERLAAAQRRR
jgi:hypothetical protein